MLKYVPVFSLVLALAQATTASAGMIQFSVGGDNTTASIQGTVDAFRAALGNPNNGNAPGPLFSGRREINWDGGGGVTANAPGGTPFNVFLNTRGAQFTTTGTGFVQAPDTGGPDGGLATFFSNPTYGATFEAFSAARLFTPVASNITDATFFIPGTNGLTPATVTGFGAVFSDVDLATSSQLQFFGVDGSLLGSVSVAPGTQPDASFSFLGVVFNAGELIGRVRIISGTTPLGPNANDNPAQGVDVVALDDFLYSEPRAVAPEPASWILFGAGGLAFAAFRRKRHGART